MIQQSHAMKKFSSDHYRRAKVGLGLLWVYFFDAVRGRGWRAFVSFRFLLLDIFSFWIFEFLIGLAKQVDFLFVWGNVRIRRQSLRICRCILPREDRCIGAWEVERSRRNSVRLSSLNTRRITKNDFLIERKSFRKKRDWERTRTW